MTAVLTFLTLVAWILFSWVQKSRMIKRFGGDSVGDEENVDILGWRKEMENTLIEERRRARIVHIVKEFDKWKTDAWEALRGRKDKGK